MKNFEALKLENQLCFPLYAASKEVVRKYHPLLEPLKLTYTQYIVMMVLWERGEVCVKELGNELYLDSGTLTPLLKNMEAKGYVKRTRSKEDERVLLVSPTKEGLRLREQAAEIPAKLAACIDLSPEENKTLSSILCKILKKCASPAFEN